MIFSVSRRSARRFCCPHRQSPRHFCCGTLQPGRILPKKPSHLGNVGYLLMLFLVLPDAASAATYYLSAAGVDTNNGRSPQTPWKTLAKASATTFHPGDSLF